MSVEWWGWGFKHGPPTARDRYVWLALANHADKAGACFPSIDLLIQETCHKKSTVQRAVKALEADGWIIRAERGNGRGKRTHYQLVKRVSDSDPLPSEAITQKGNPADSHAESQRTEKGVTLTKPPHPHIGVTVNEPSNGTGRGEPSCARGEHSLRIPVDVGR